MNETPKYRGLVPPVITPLADRDALDREGFARLLENLLEGGVNGVFVLGTTGEGPSLSKRLQQEVIDEAVKIVAGRVPVFVGITDTSLVESLSLAEHAAQAGADVLVTAPPFYFPAGQTELRHYFDELLARLSLPLMLYNMPSCTKISIEMETLAHYFDQEHVVGLKDSSGDLEYLRAATVEIGRQRPDWSVFVGPEALLAESLAFGVHGGVCGGANLLPSLFASLYEAHERGDTETVLERHRVVVELGRLYQIGKYGSAFLKSIKCALELRGVCSGLLAAPFDAFHYPERKKVQRFLDEFEEEGWFEPGFFRESAGAV